MTIDLSYRPEHILRDSGQIIEIRCKCCDRLIQGQVQSDHPKHNLPPRKLQDGTLLRTAVMVTLPLPSYRELTILCRDDAGIGHRHVTHVCASCLPKVSTDKEALTKMMQHDILDQVHYEGLDPAIAKLLMSRFVEGVE